MKPEEEQEIEDVADFLKSQDVKQETDLTGTIKNLNDDQLEKETGLSSIDTKTRLHPFDISNINVHDVLIGMKCIPRVCSITTRVKKRLVVSMFGRGREEIVRIVTGEREHQSKGGFGDIMKGMFKGKEGEP